MTNQHPEIIFIEGVCGTGKSTLVRELSALLSSFSIPELPEFNRHILLPYENSENIRDNFSTNLKCEIIREHILGANTFESATFIFDRSYFSLMALSQGFKDYLPIKFRIELIKEIKNKILNGELYCPNKILCLMSSHDTTMKRNNEKTKNLSDLWTSYDRFARQEKVYNFFGNLNIIHLIDAEDNISLVCNKCLHIIKHTKNLTKDQLIESLDLYEKWVISNER